MTEIQASPELIAKWETEYKKGFAKPLILFYYQKGTITHIRSQKIFLYLVKDKFRLLRQISTLY